MSICGHKNFNSNNNNNHDCDFNNNNNSNDNLRLFNITTTLHQKAYLTQLSGYYILYIIMVRGLLRLIYVKSGSTVPRLSILPLSPWNKKDLSLSGLLLKAKKTSRYFLFTYGVVLQMSLYFLLLKRRNSLLPD